MVKNSIIIFLFIFVKSIWAQPLLVENFDYTNGTNLTSNEWSAHDASGVNPATVTSPGLTYSGYASSGIGNAAVFDGGSGSREDVNRGIAAQTSGNVYFSFLVNISNALSGSYFIHLGDRTSPSSFSNFCARVFAQNLDGNLRFGLSNSSTGFYSSTDFSYNTTYLIIVKYTINPSGNDEVVMWVKSDGVPQSEIDAGTPLISITDQDGEDVIDAIAIRQGAGGPDGTIDGIRIGAIWGDAPLPVTLSSFTARGSDSNVSLKWITESEVDNQGFYLYRSFDKEENYEQLSNLIPGAGNSAARNTYSYTDYGVINGLTYWYKLVDVDINGVRTEHPVISAIPHVSSAEIGVDNVGETPSKFALKDNYPNPFNPETTIGFDIPDTENELVNINLSVYDMLGKKVKTLINEPLGPNSYNVKWNGTNDYGRLVPSGVYFYLLKSESFIKSNKMILIR